jgi:hypothetical protein
MSQTHTDNIHDKINRETARIHWNELETFFAAGKLIYISQDIDLIDVAIAMTEDKADKINQWMSTGQVSNAIDEQAMHWQKHNTEFWAVVIKPWILVQEPQ